MNIPAFIMFFFGGMSFACSVAAFAAGIRLFLQ